MREQRERPVGKGGRAVPEIESKCNAIFIAPILKACFSDCGIKEIIFTATI